MFIPFSVKQGLDHGHVLANEDVCRWGQCTLLLWYSVCVGPDSSCNSALLGVPSVQMVSVSLVVQLCQAGPVRCAGICRQGSQIQTEPILPLRVLVCLEHPGFLKASQDLQQGKPARCIPNVRATIDEQCR